MGEDGSNYILMLKKKKAERGYNRTAGRVTACGLFFSFMNSSAVSSAGVGFTSVLPVHDGYSAHSGHIRDFLRDMNLQPHLRFRLLLRKA